MEPQKQGYWQTEPSSPAQHVPSSSDVPGGAPVLADSHSAPTNTDHSHDDHPMHQTLAWEASEYIHHEKDGLWFIVFAAIAAILTLLAIYLMQSWSFAILIIVMAGAVVYMSVRPPRILKYQLSSRGLQINETNYSYDDFRAFGVVQEGMIYYITLVPIKRFSPSIDLYFPQEYGERIVDMIGGQVPMKTIEPDFVDRLTKKLRF